MQTVFQALVFSVRHYPVLVPSELWTEGEDLMPLPTVFLGILWVLVAQCLQSISDLTNRRFVLCLALPVQKYKIFVQELIYLYECNDLFFFSLISPKYSYFHFVYWKLFEEVFFAMLLVESVQITEGICNAAQKKE